MSCGCLWCVDMMFTRNNVQRAVRNVRRADILGPWLGVPLRRLKDIQRQFRGDEGRQVEEYVTYFMNYDPLASWRRVIVVLDKMKLIGGKDAADKIRHLAESVTGEDRSCGERGVVTETGGGGGGHQSTGPPDIHSGCAWSYKPQCASTYYLVHVLHYCHYLSPNLTASKPCLSVLFVCHLSNAPVIRGAPQQIIV